MNIVSYIYHHKFIRFAFVGGLAAIIDLAVFTLINVVLHIHYQIALVCAFATAATTKFFINKTFTFKNKSTKTGRQYSIFIGLQFFALLISMAFMWFFVEIVLLFPVVARIVVTFLVLFINYNMDKYITFGKNT